MTTRRSVAILAAILIIAGLVIALQMSAAEDGVMSSSDNEPRVVAAVAAESVTEYEPDPFEPERLRSSTVRVRQVAIVYSDGTIELKRP